MPDNKRFEVSPEAIEGLVSSGLGRVGEILLWAGNFIPNMEQDAADTMKRVGFTAIGLTGNGQVTATDNQLRIDFAPDPRGVFDLRLALDSDLASQATSVCAIISVSGFESIDYVAIGFQVGDRFQHVQVKHLLQDTPTLIRFHSQSTLASLYGTPDTDDKPNSIRLFFKGNNQEAGATVVVHGVVVCNDEEKFRIAEPETSDDEGEGDAGQTIEEQLVKSLLEYQTRTWPEVDRHLKEWDEGSSLSFSKATRVPWPANQAQPTVHGSQLTERYMWHALQPLTLLMVRYSREGRVADLAAGRELVAIWAQANLFEPTEDRKYAWYDHGLAERSLALLLLKHFGEKNGFDRLFMGRLLHIIAHHGDMLADETFYARDQRYRFHNHAIFQDFALYLIAAMVPEIAVSRAWRKLAVERLTKQIDTLVLEEDRYAVLKENSPGYHGGITTLLDSITKFLKICGEASLLSRVVTKMRVWSKDFLYLSGSFPAIGDTFRRPNTEQFQKACRKSSDHEPGVYQAAEAGYLQVRGVSRSSSTPFQLFFSAPNLTHTHKHADHLSLTLFFDGLEWLIDPSFLSHEYDKPMEAYLRGPLAHNMVHLRNAEFSMELERASIGLVEATEDHAVMKGTHGAYREATISRTLDAAFDALDIEVVEQVEKIEECSPVLHLHCGEQIDVSIDGRDVLLTSSLSEKRIKVRFSEGAPVVVSGEENPDGLPTAGWAATSFKNVSKTNTIVVSFPEGVTDLSWTIAEA